MASLPSSVEQAISNASSQTGVPVAILRAQALQESSGNVNARNPSGAGGLYQILPSTARDPGYGITPLSDADRFDPDKSAMFAAQYDKALYNANGQNWNAALSQYSGGGYTLSSLASKYPDVIGDVASIGAPSNVNGTATTTPSTAGAKQAGWGKTISEFFTRASLVFFGIGLVLIALIFMLINSKTVKTSVKSIASLA